MTQRAEAAAVADAYVALSDDGRRNFLLLLARDFWTDPAAVDDAVVALVGSATTGATGGAPSARRARAARRPAAAPLHRPRRRREVPRRPARRRAAASRSRRRRSSPSSTASCKAQLATLFDVGLLELRRITWDAPAALLEKLIEYEAVHTIGSWDDLKNRLDSDRRCYAFFHPAMPDEPLVFVEIALTAGIATRARAAARRARARARSRPRRHRGLLFDLELPARPRRREPRHRAHQAGRRGAAPSTCRSCGGS